MAAASLQCYPLLNSPPVSVSRSFSARTPVRGRTGQALGSRMKLCCCSQSAERQPPDDSPPQLGRLFSNVNQATMKHEPGNHARIMQSAVFLNFLAHIFAFEVHLMMGSCLCFFTWVPGSVTGSILLVAGTTVGAGILAIPAVTQEAGFLASAVTCIFCWIYMVVTGLLVAEVNVNTMCELGSGGVSLVSMAQRTLGTFGVRTACFSYLFIHYALLVAYVARSSEIITNSLGIPLWESATLFSLAFGGLCYFGSQRVIGAVNGFLVFSIIASFTTLVVVASGNIQWSSLLETNFAAAPQSLPIIALSFVYQNVVPVLCTNLEGDLPKVRKAIVLGTAIPLALFLIWDAVILGTIPGLAGSETITDPLQQLRSSNGIVGPIVEAFSFLAICTSYIGFVLGLSDFIADLLKLPSGQNKPLTYLVTLFPPLVLSLLDPEIFFKALDFAGTYGVLVLFGVFPAAMSWSERYSDELEAPISPIVPGGKFTLSFVMGGALFVIFSEIFKDILQLQGLH